MRRQSPFTDSTGASVRPEQHKLDNQSSSGRVPRAGIMTHRALAPGGLRSFQADGDGRIRHSNGRRHAK